MSFRDFPRIKGPPPMVWAGLMLGVSLGGLVYFPGPEVFLGLNFLNIALILVVVILGQRLIPRSDQNFILLAGLFVVLGLYGFYRGFDKAAIYLVEIFQVFPALVFYFALRLYRIHYGIKKAADFANTLIPEERLHYADLIRSKFKKHPGALEAAARIYKEVADQVLEGYQDVLPFHIVAMQKYGNMLLYDEARGRPGEAEWYAKKAHE